MIREIIEKQEQEQRQNFRRYSDRRIALLLEIYETLFHNDPGPPRDQAILEVIRQNFEADRACLVKPGGGAKGVDVLAHAGEWISSPKGRVLTGSGLRLLLELHEATPGTLTLSRVKRPSAFSQPAWDSLWSGDLGAQAMALLSIVIRPQKSRKTILWLYQCSYSREWSSRDRQLAEEVAALLAKAADKETARP